MLIHKYLLFPSAEVQGRFFLSAGFPICRAHKSLRWDSRLLHAIKGVCHGELETLKPLDRLLKGLSTKEWNPRQQCQSGSGHPSGCSTNAEMESGIITWGVGGADAKSILLCPPLLEFRKQNQLCDPRIHRCKNSKLSVPPLIPLWNKAFDQYTLIHFYTNCMIKVYAQSPVSAKNGLTGTEENKILRYFSKGFHTKCL